MTINTMSPLVEQQFRATATSRKQVLIDNMLAESNGLTTMQVLEEGAGSSGVLIVEGKVGQCGKPTANKRMYERKIMEREIHRLQEKINSRASLASVDHPGDGKSRIRDAGAICVGLRVESDGSIIGRYEIVEESSGGKDLAAFLRRGAAIGMSSRGLGSTRMSPDGYHVVGEDFKLHGFDFVADPACRDAFPTLVSEDIDPEGITEDELRVRYPSLLEQIEDRARQTGAEVAEEESLSKTAKVREQVEEEYKQSLDEARETLREDIKLEVLAEVRESLREDFAAKLLQSLQQLKEETREVVRSELLSDPSVAGAKKFMADLAEQLVPYRPDPDQQALMDAREREIESLREQIAQRDHAIVERNELQQQTEKQARSLGFRLFVERALQGFEQADEMRNMVGDPDKFETVEELQDRVKAVIAQVQESERSADERASVAVKVEEHKADLARTKASRLEDQLDHVRNEFADKLERFAARMDSQLKDKDALLAEAADEIDRLRERSVLAERTAHDADLTAYAVRRVQGHPRADDILAAVKSGRVSTKDGVRQLAEQWDRRGEEPGGAAERIRRTLGHGYESPTEGDRTTFQRLTEDRNPVPGLETFDTTMGELRHLAGIGQDNGRRRF